MTNLPKYTLIVSCCAIAILATVAAPAGAAVDLELDAAAAAPGAA